MNYQNGADQRELDEEREAQECFRESEWLLSFLRTLSSEPLPKPTEDHICQIFTQT